MRLISECVITLILWLYEHDRMYNMLENRGEGVAKSTYPNKYA